MATAKLDLERLITLTRRRAEKICEGLGNAAPTNLVRLGEKRRIGSVRFQPILGSGGLLKTKDGFDVVINTDGRGAQERPADVLPAKSSNWNVLTSPVRFTIAHEIAQALLVEVAGGDPHKDIFFKNEQALDSFCNELASKFLMPKRQVEKAISGNVFDAPHLARIPDQFLVSPDAFMQRIDSADFREDFSETDGLAALVREGQAQGSSFENLQFVTGKIWGARALNQFGLGPKEAGRGRDTKFPIGRSIAEVDFGGIPPELFRTRDHEKRLFSVQWRGGRPENLLNCELEFQWIRERPLALILTIRVVAGPAPKVK